MGKRTLDNIKVTLEWLFVVQILLNFEIFKLSLKSFPYALRNSNFLLFTIESLSPVMHA